MRKERLTPRTYRYSSWRLGLGKDKGIVSLDESISSASCCSSDEAESSGYRSDHDRLKYTLPPKMVGDADVSMLRIIPHKSNPDKTLVVIPKFLSVSRIKKLLELFQSSETVYEVKDRKEDLYHAHTAYRVEVALRLSLDRT